MGLALARKLSDEDQLSPQRKRILFVINADWFFLSHRQVLADAAYREGYEVFVAAPDTGRADEIRRRGFNFIELPPSAKGLSRILVKELKLLLTLFRLYRRLRPDIIHHSTPKVVLIGTLAARLVSSTRVINLISGLGYIFSRNMHARLLRPLVAPLFRLALYHPDCCTVFQNPENRELFIERKLVKRQHTELIRGSGVNCKIFAPRQENTATPTVTLISRLLWDKGVGEFVESARELKKRFPDARFVLVGKPDRGNPSAIPEAQLQEWVDEGCVEWWGHRSDIPYVLAASSVVVLPSYHEGLPKSLIEAAAAGRPIVATDIPGCREIVKHEVNGLLVPVQDSTALAEAIARLLDSPELRREYGEAGRWICLREFDEKIVADRFMSVCTNLVTDTEVLSVEDKIRARLHEQAQAEPTDDSDALRDRAAA